MTLHSKVKDKKYREKYVKEDETKYFRHKNLKKIFQKSDCHRV